MGVSICSLTWNRLHAVQRCYAHNFQQCGLPRHELQLMVTDQGSTDGVVQYIAGLGIDDHRLNKFNEGIGRSLNQMMVRARGDYICLAGTDILNKPGWLRELVNYAEAVPNAGIVGIKCTAEIPPIQTKPDKNGNPCHAHYLTPTCDKVFGTMLFSRKVLETVGGFFEELHPYGFEDSDFNNRVTLAGFTSLYVPASHWTSSHVADDVGSGSEYRRLKDDSLRRNLSIFGERHKLYLAKTLPIHCPLPLPRPPMETPEQYAPPPDNVSLSDALRTPMGG